MASVTPTNDAIWRVLRQVEDPEIPVLNVVEMGIVRDVQVGDEGITVAITPTYSGCPAMDAIADAIKIQLKDAAMGEVQVKTVFNPPWTSDWITDEAKQKLKDYGIAPPTPRRIAHLKKPWLAKPAEANCPYCDASDTQLKSAFGSTACKSLHYCNACHQPFEHFKCI